MSEKAKFVLGISLGLTLFILLIIGFVVLYILIKKRMKLKKKEIMKIQKFWMQR